MDWSDRHCRVSHRLGEVPRSGTNSPLQMATIGECRYRWLRLPATNRKSLVEKLFYMERQPRDNPGYVSNERK